MFDGRLMEDNKTSNIQIKFLKSRLQSRVSLKYVYVEIWAFCFGIRYKAKAIFVCNAYPATILPKFRKIGKIYQVLGFDYFELNQSYKTYKNIDNNMTIVSI